MIYVSQLDIKKDFVDDIINMFRENFTDTFVWDETRVLSMTKYGLDTEKNKVVYSKIFDLVKKVQSLVSHDNRFKFIENAEIVKYPQGASKCYHYDVARKSTEAASITYLNDDYIGGQTVISGVNVQPLQGRTVYFDGTSNRHCVENVLKGDRYTLSIWYGHNPESTVNKEFNENV